MAVPPVIRLIGGRKRGRPGPGRTVRAAIPMLPPDIQAVVTAALWRDEEDSIQPHGAKPADRLGLERASVPPLTGAPPYLFVVRSGQALTFNSLRELAWARPDLLGVVFDRRWMGERRGQNRSGHAERRCTQRRRTVPESSWTKRGFMLASAGTPVQPASAPSRNPLPHPAVPVERAEVAPVPSRSRSVGRAVLGLGTVLLVGAVAAAGFDRWAREHSANVTESTLSGGPSPALPPALPGIVRAEPPPPVLTAPAPTLARPSPEPPPTRLARRDPPPAVARPVAPAEPVGAAGVAVAQCVTPTSPMVAVRSGEVLGALVGMKIDADSRPPRCFFVVKRGDGTLWVIDSSRAEARAR